MYSNKGAMLLVCIIANERERALATESCDLAIVRLK
jgi:hypothetical protein